MAMRHAVSTKALFGALYARAKAAIITPALLLLAGKSAKAIGAVGRINNFISGDTTRRTRAGALDETHEKGLSPTPPPLSPRVRRSVNANAADPGQSAATAIMFSFRKLPSAKDARNRRGASADGTGPEGEGWGVGRGNRASGGCATASRGRGRACRAYRASRFGRDGAGGAIMIITGIRGVQLGQRSDRNALVHAPRRGRFPPSCSFFYFHVQINVGIALIAPLDGQRAAAFACERNRRNSRSRVNREVIRRCALARKRRLRFWDRYVHDRASLLASLE